uniref:L-sorbosone dehydrogenase n=1 Tax=uncultured marine group II/III euryarchaeote KM3_155_G07 TaxID=1457898 RepID=A0A075GJY2_9EURY|nr:L-sorbosone dehydrogenase [uncultured marine group II/III euryarchaeote KM3_155_G07]
MHCGNIIKSGRRRQTVEQENEEAEPEAKSRPRIPKVGIVVIVIFLIVGGMTLRQMWPYLVKPSPELAIEGHVVEQVAEGLGSPSCLHWMDENWLLVCDRTGRLLALELDESGNISTPLVLLGDLDEPHGVLVWEDPGNGSSRLLVSVKGELLAWNIGENSTPENWLLENPQILVTGVPTGNHQTNAVMPFSESSVLWHVGSTCNICDEEDERNAAIMKVDAWTGEHEVVASGVRNSYDGTWVPGIGYLFTDNGRDWEGDHPPEELNLLLEGSAYGWPDDDPDHPVPDGTLGPIAEFTSHSSANGIDWRPPTSSLPGGNRTVYVSLFGSWNTVIPVGQEIVRVDLSPDSENPQNWSGVVTPVLDGLQTPLPLRFHPDGDLYYAEYAQGTLHRVTAG